MVPERRRTEVELVEGPKSKRTREATKIFGLRKSKLRFPDYINGNKYFFLVYSSRQNLTKKLH